MSQIASTTPTDTEIKQAAEILSRLKPGYLPTPIFDALAPLVVMSIMELVPVRTSAEGRTEVLLTRRAPDDKLWPNLWHNPGCVIRPSDEAGTYKDAFRRLLQEELGGLEISGLPVGIGARHNYIERGYNNCLVYWAEVKGEPKVGQFFDSRSLPADTMTVQRALIHDAVAHYERCRREVFGS